jgi:uncharacterized protein (TIGR03067 family)
VEWIEDGRGLPQDVLRNQVSREGRVTFTAKTMTLTPPGRRRELSYRLHPDREPRGIDVTETGHSAALTGIYRLNGDTLRLCLALPDAKEPPKKFESNPGSKHALLILKRVKEP